MSVNRGHEPARPQPIAQSVDGGIHFSSEYGMGGMSVREEMAKDIMAAALTGLLADGSDWPDKQTLVIKSIAYTDALIEGLEHSR